jgi:hypothetical protein
VESVFPRRRHEHQGRRHLDDQRGAVGPGPLRRALRGQPDDARGLRGPRARGDPRRAPFHPHHRRDGHGQGAGRSWAPRRVGPRRRPVRGARLHDAAARAGGVTHPGPRARDVHRGGARPRRAVRAGPRRDAVHRRARRAAVRAAGQITAVARARGGRPAGRGERAEGQCSRDRGDPPRSAAYDESGQIPGRPVFSPRGQAPWNSPRCASSGTIFSCSLAASWRRARAPGRRPRC